jgi:hypothetical protein
MAVGIVLLRVFCGFPAAPKGNFRTKRGNFGTLRRFTQRHRGQNLS